MKLLYISNVKMPTNKAHGVHMIKMCEAFSLAGLDVTFVVPFRLTGMKDDPFRYYNVKKIFKIKRIFSIDAIHSIPFIGYPIQLISFAIIAGVRYFFSSRKNTAVHTREYIIAAFFKILGFRTTFEAHSVVGHKWLFFKLASLADAIITNSQGVASEFLKKGFKNVLALPNGVNLSDFEIAESKEEIRRELSLSIDRRIALYSGHLYKWKGIDTLVAAAKNLSDKNIDIVCVGGTDNDVKNYRDIVKKENLSNIFFIGHVKNALVPKYLKAADVLLLPNSPVSEESVRYTSPMKLFEYMASGVPIVVSDLPSMREILKNNTAVFFRPDDAGDLAGRILELLQDKALTDRISSQALSEVGRYTWENRARKIIDFAHYNI